MNIVFCDVILVVLWNTMAVIIYFSRIRNSWRIWLNTLFRSSGFKNWILRACSGSMRNCMPKGWSGPTVI